MALNVFKLALLAVAPILTFGVCPDRGVREHCHCTMHIAGAGSCCISWRP